MKLILFCLMPLLVIDIDHAAANSFSPIFDCNEADAMPLVEEKAMEVAQQTCDNNYVDLNISMTSIRMSTMGSTHYFVKFQCEKNKKSFSAVLTSTPLDYCSKVSYQLVKQPFSEKLNASGT